MARDDAVVFARGVLGPEMRPPFLVRRRRRRWVGFLALCCFAEAVIGWMMERMNKRQKRWTVVALDLMVGMDQYCRHDSAGATTRGQQGRGKNNNNELENFQEFGHSLEKWF